MKENNFLVSLVFWKKYLPRKLDTKETIMKPNKSKQHQDLQEAAGLKTHCSRSKSVLTMDDLDPVTI